MDNVEITDAQFDAALEELLSELSANQLLDIPGIYEILSEYFNNDIIEIVRATGVAESFEAALERRHRYDEDDNV